MMRPNLFRSMPRLAALAGSLLAALPMLALSALHAQTQEPVEYLLTFDNRLHHEARVQVVFPDASQGLWIRMSRSSPGRYALHEFAKNVSAVEAVDAAGRPLPMTRPDPYSWWVAPVTGAVIFRYTLYGDRGDGTYNQIDASHAHLNAPATFVWAEEQRGRPATVRLQLPPAWRVATQLEPTERSDVFRARDLEYLLDSPIEASDHRLFEWRLDRRLDPSRQTIRVALHTDRGTRDLGEDSGRAEQEFVAGVRRIVDETIALFGDVPRFDHGVYTFLACYLPWVSGDGMEHRNSTVLTSSAALEESRVGLLGTVAHEFVHAWNVERIRPASLEPFDYTTGNPSEELWFGEGFTSYLEDLLLARAGIVSLEELASRVGGMVDAITNAPGRLEGSPRAMSRRAIFVDAASWTDPTNRDNTFYSYYSYGAALGLALDLDLRRRFGKSLDDLMALAWERFGRPFEAYDHADLEALVAEVSGDEQYARDFFAAFVEDNQLPDFERLLAAAGMAPVPRNPARPWIGEALLEAGDDGVRVGATTRGSPLYEAGLDRDDVILQIDGRRVERPEQLQKRISGKRPGDRIELEVRSRGTRRVTVLEVDDDPELTVELFEERGRRVDEEVLRFRERWLGSRTPSAVDG